MTQQFRTTISLVAWHDTTEESQALVEQVKAQVPEEWRERTLASIEFIAEGPPLPPEPLTVNNGLA